MKLSHIIGLTAITLSTIGFVGFVDHQISTVSVNYDDTYIGEYHCKDNTFRPRHFNSAGLNSFRWHTSNELLSEMSNHTGLVKNNGVFGTLGAMMFVSALYESGQEMCDN